MKQAVFLDTNLFVCADDASVPVKKERTIELIAQCQASGAATISPQVIQEYFAIATRKLGVDPELAQRKVELGVWAMCAW